ncbi:MAG: hypothetical protein MASP_00237 [Candidatus Methanolliviera sp. GoM_asphalt]|nr:MAG: hypothetical protein MASP_00237 [Candidatus Methanolliviera sp. GoM_asphalt]
MEPIIIDDGRTLLKITIEEVAKLHEELIDGKPCICVSSSFRAAQLAFSKLWHEEIPKRDDMKIISALPTEGSQQTFKYILGERSKEDFRLELPEGTSVENLASHNHVFTFVRKRTNTSIQVRARPEIFPKEFFQQRKLVEYAIPREETKEEKEEFEKLEREVRDKFLTLPPGDLFISKIGEVVI